VTALSVSASGPAADAIAAAVPQLVEAQFASKLFAQDPTLWGEAAVSESSKRLSWVGLGRSSRPLLGEIAALRDDLVGKGLDHVVLCGMGGSSLAPEVICATEGKELVVLDSSDPDYVRTALQDKLDRTVVVVSSKSGSTVETDSQKRAYEGAFTDAGIDATERIVVVTDPGSPLDASAREAGYRVINADPDVGGRYSALTAFGLVPSGLAGVDIEALLDDAESVADLLAADDDANPGLRLGAAIGGTNPLRNKLAIVDDGSGIVGFADWAEQLIAESTGKEGTGILPVVEHDDSDPEVRWPAHDVTVVHLVNVDADDAPTSTDTDLVEVDPSRSEVEVSGSLGAQMLLWEVATAAAGRLLGINPFDQPDVESAKAAARDLLGQGIGGAAAPAATDGAVEIRTMGGEGQWLGGATTVAGALDALFAQLDPNQGYVAVMAYLDRISDAPLAACRRAIATRTERPTTFGWGPRFLHSTGQFHKGGPAVGVYLQITSRPKEDLAIPGRDFTFGDFIAAQAGGDAAVLAQHGRPVLQLHLTDHDAGLAQLERVLGVGGSEVQAGTSGAARGEA
jgi:glucose-6-phosphate isomerase